MHGLVERDERLLQKLSQPLADTQLGQMILQVASPMFAKKLDRRLDLAGERRGIFYRDAKHRLQCGFGERYDRPRTPAFG